MVDALSLETFGQTGQVSEQPDLMEVLTAEQVDWITFKGLFQPKLFYDSGNLHCLQDWTQISQILNRTMNILLFYTLRCGGEWSNRQVQLMQEWLEALWKHVKWFDFVERLEEYLQVLKCDTH